MSKEEKIINIPLYLVLSLLTCGLWYLYWLYKQTETINDLDRRENLSFIFFLVLSILTCGLYAIYYYYKISVSIMKIQTQRNLPEDQNLPIISLLLVLFGVPFVATCIHQMKFNEIVRKTEL